MVYISVHYDALNMTSTCSFSLYFIDSEWNENTYSGITQSFSTTSNIWQLTGSNYFTGCIQSNG